jgi:hypothetical protein
MNSTVCFKKSSPSILSLGTQSTGLLFFDEDAWEEADDCHRIEMLAKAFVRQWIGGLVTIDSAKDICFQVTFPYIV